MIYAAWFVWILPLVAVPFATVIGIADKSKRLAGWFAVAVVAVTTAFGFYLAATFATAAGSTIGALWIPYLNVSISVEVDGLSALLSAFICLLALLIIIYSVGYMKGEGGLARYYSLILLFVGSMLALVMAANLIQLYFFWELVGICSALLIAFYNDKPEARRAGMKAFIATRFGDVSLLIAVLFSLSLLKSTSFQAILSAVSGKTIGTGTIEVLGILLFIGAMGKSAQVPLQVWLPDAMEGPTPVSALIHAATMVNAGVYLILRMFPLFQASQLLLALVTAIGAITMIYGGACAIASEDFKRILAYSTISQLGLMFVGIGVGTSLGATYQLISQGFFKALAFMVAGSVLHATGTRDVEALGGLKATMKYSHVGFLIAIAGMSGIPPLLGFWSKDWIFSVSLGSNPGAAILILLSSILTAVYGFRAFFKVFYGKTKLQKLPSEAPPVMVVPIVFLSVSVLVGWLFFDYQRVLPFPVFQSIDVATVGVSLVAIAAGLAASYFAFYSRISATQAVIQRSQILVDIRKFLLVGMGFDAVYRTLYSRVVLPLARYASDIETGELGLNSALMLALLLVILFVLVIQVI